LHSNMYNWKVEGSRIVRTGCYLYYL